MMKTKNPKTRCSGTWTEARYNSFIKSGIRSLTRKWKPMYDALKEAETEKKINEKTGRVAQHYRCVGCRRDYPVKEVAIDHIEPIVPVTGFTTWDDIISRALCEKSGFQVLCKSCHAIKCKEENEQRKKHGRITEI